MKNHLSKLIAVMFVLMFISARAGTNYWIAPTDGNWDDTNAWSLGILPDSSQSVWITNENQKTVMITSQGAQEFPDSLTVQRLTLAGENALVLDHVSARVMDDRPGNSYEFALSLWPGSKLINSESHLIVNGAGESLSSAGDFIQSGGLTELLSAARIGGTVSVSNGVFQGGYIELGAVFNQIGGQATIGALELNGGCYNLTQGVLNTERIDFGVFGGTGTFSQDGGTNRTSYLYLFPSPAAYPASTTYRLTQRCANQQRIFGC